MFITGNRHNPFRTGRGPVFWDAPAWYEKIQPVVPLVEYIDIEQRFASYAPRVREAGKMIIASHHSAGMISLHDLFMLERELRTYGDMVKIIVTPGDEEDIIDLISFTHTIQNPVCTGVMGTQFRYARAILPLFGSHLVYCNTGTPTAAGQYSVEEFVRLMALLKGVPHMPPDSGSLIDGIDNGYRCIFLELAVSNLSTDYKQ